MNESQYSNLLDQQLPEDRNVFKVINFNSFTFTSICCVFSLYWGYWFYEHLLRTQLAVNGGEVQWMEDIVGLLLRLLPVPFFLSCWGTWITKVLYKEIIFYPGSMTVKARIRVMRDLHYSMNYAFIHIQRTHFWGHVYARLCGATGVNAPFVPISRLVYLFGGVEDHMYREIGASVIKVSHNDNKMSYQLHSPNSLKWTYGWSGWIGLLIWILSSFAFIGAVIYLIGLLFVVEEITFTEYILLGGFIIVFGFVTYLALTSLRLQERFEALRSIRYVLMQPNSITICYRNEEDQRLDFDEFRGVKNMNNSDVKFEYIVNEESHSEYLPWPCFEIHEGIKMYYNSLYHE